ncbi:MAG: hypothetical protein Q9218_003401 [Villophora microphyllina]
MRLERAYLLEKLAELQKKNGEPIEGLPTDMDEDSEGSSEGPPTPHEKPLRSKRSHRRPLQQSPPPHSALAPSSTPRHHGNMSNHHLTQRRGGPGAYESAFPAHQSPHEHHVPYTQYQPIANGHPTLPSNNGSQSHHPAAVPLDPWNAWVDNYITNVDPNVQQFSVADQLNAAREAWASLSPREQERWQQQCQQRGVAYETEGRGQTIQHRGGDDDSVAEGEEEGDEEMEGAAAGGFTAVNG